MIRQALRATRNAESVWYMTYVLSISRAAYKARRRFGQRDPKPLLRVASRGHSKRLPVTRMAPSVTRGHLFALLE
jgi:hypothetical protein